MDFVAVMFPDLPGSAPVAWLVLYIGPEVFMPVLSAIAGALGVLLMFWQKVTGVVARAWRTMFGRRG
jgi:hypothetical protein